MANGTPTSEPGLEHPVEIDPAIGAGYLSTDGRFAAPRRFRARVHFVGGRLHRVASVQAMRKLRRESPERHIGPGGIYGEGGHLVTIDVELSLTGSPTCRALRIEPEPPSHEPIAAVDVRVPLLRLMKLAVAEATVELGPRDAKGDHIAIHGTAEPVDNFVAEHREGRRPPRRGAPLTETDLRRAAAVYRAAESDRRRRHAPRKAVADAEGISVRQASNRIKLARERGLL